MQNTSKSGCKFIIPFFTYLVKICFNITYMKKYKLFVFDCDGTLIDSKWLIHEAIQHAANQLNLGRVIINDEHKNVGMTLKELVEELFPGVDYPLFNKEFHDYYSAEKLSNCFFPGAVESLQNLKVNGAKLAMATNIIRTKVDLLLQDVNLKKLFNAVRCADDGFPKPNPQMIFSILDELKVNATDAVMIGDSTYDMQLADNACIDAIAVDYGGTDIQKLLQYKPIARLHDIREINRFYDLLSK